MIVFACTSVFALVYMYVYQCVVTCFPVCVRNLIVNIWGPQTMRAYIFLGFIFLEIRKKEKFWILSLDSITCTKNNHKPPKGSLSSSQLFVTSLHFQLPYVVKNVSSWISRYDKMESFYCTFWFAESQMTVIVPVYFYYRLYFFQDCTV